MAAIEACPEWLDWAVASHALNGAEHSGDIHVVMPHSRGVLLGVADGLGHGPEAAGAASAAAHVCKRYAERTVTELLMLDKLSYDIHMVAEGMLQRGMIDVEAPGSVRVGSAAH